MGMVIDMKARRPAQRARAFPKWEVSTPRLYACMRCDGALFRILENGLMRCAHCAAEIADLTLARR